jgi:acyl-CoA thioesterase-1
MGRTAVIVVLAGLLALGCGSDRSPRIEEKKNPDPEGPRTFAPAEGGGSEASAGAPLVLFLGDSLTAGFGLSEDEAFPALVAARLEERAIAARVVNAGVSGDTSAGGLSRLPWLLRQKPAVVVVALGANDGLRGLPLAQTEENLRRIVAACQEAGARVVLAGMMIPPNYGPDYFQGFRALFPRVAKAQRVPLIPFLLEGVAAEDTLNLSDGIHPNAEGQRRVAENVLPYVVEALRKAA